MALPPRLAKLRDTEALKYCNNHSIRVKLYGQGFDACAAEMLPMLEKMAEALEASRDGNGIAEDALAAYRAWAEEEK